MSDPRFEIFEKNPSVTAVVESDQSCDVIETGLPIKFVLPKASENHQNWFDIM